MISLVYVTIMLGRIFRKPLSKDKDLSAEVLSLKRSARRSSFKGWASNPFTHQEIRLLVLSGIMFSDNSPASAVINNEIYGVGDTVEGNKIIEIKEDQVILSDTSHTFTLFATPIGDVSIEP